MPVLSLSPALTLLAAFQRVSPVIPLRTLLRTTSDRLRPSRPRPHAVRVRTAQAALLQSGQAEARQLSSTWLEPHPGPVPTIVLGGFVPDSTEQVYMLRGHLLKFGPLYYLNYPPDGFSLDLFCAQLDDLVAETTLTSAQPPVIFAVSFGGGLVLEWLRRARARGRTLPLSGVVLVSPVACVADLIAPGEAKPSTLLGRALLPYINACAPVGPAVVEKSRMIFSRMFEAGAQNKESTRLLLTAGELEHLRSAVQGTIRRVSPTGAWERIQALRAMTTPDAGSPSAAPLTADPVLILYAEKESAVLTENSPTRLALESAHRSWLPESKVCLIANRSGPPVQHASLVFHYGNFLPLIAAFYRRLRNGKTRAAA